MSVIKWKQISEQLGADGHLTGSLHISGSILINENDITSDIQNLQSSVNLLDSSSVKNNTDIYTGSAKITNIISLTTAEYNGIVDKDENTLYVIV